MLVKKELSIKKLMIYFSIIFFMIGGTGFMVYKNKQITAPREANVNIPMVFDNNVPNTGAQVPASDSKVVNLGQIIDKNSKNGSLDLDIFSSDKFKNLQASEFIIKEQLEVGKRNPFQPN